MTMLSNRSINGHVHFVKMLSILSECSLFQHVHCQHDQPVNISAVTMFTLLHATYPFCQLSILSTLPMFYHILSVNFLLSNMSTLLRVQHICWLLHRLSTTPDIHYIPCLPCPLLLIRSVEWKKESKQKLGNPYQSLLPAKKVCKTKIKFNKKGKKYL